MTISCVAPRQLSHVVRHYQSAPTASSGNESLCFSAGAGSVQLIIIITAAIFLAAGDRAHSALHDQQNVRDVTSQLKEISIINIVLLAAARAHARTDTHTHARSLARTRGTTHTRARTHTHTHVRTHAHTQARARTHTYTHTHTLTIRTHARTHARTRHAHDIGMHVKHTGAAY